MLYRVLLIALLATSACAVSSAQLVERTDGAFFALSVADSERMIEWYRDTLGFEVVSRGENDERRGALLRRDGALLEIAEFRNARTRSAWGVSADDYLVHGIFKLGFVVEDLDAAHAAAQERQLDLLFGPVAAGNDLRTFGLRDPEGNRVQLFGQ